MATTNHERGGALAEFFRRTCVTESLKQFLADAIHRLSGQGGHPVVQLQTNCRDPRHHRPFLGVVKKQPTLGAPPSKRHRTTQAGKMPAFPAVALLFDESLPHPRPPWPAERPGHPQGGPMT